MQLVAEHIGNNITVLSDYENQFNEFDSGEVRFYVEQDLSNEEIAQLESDIVGQGVVLTSPILQDANMIVIKFRKELAPLAIIALAVGGMGAIGILGWQLFKYISAVPWWVWIAGGIAIFMVIFSKDKKDKESDNKSISIQANKLYLNKENNNEQK
jgi:hypothetical protein